MTNNNANVSATAASTKKRRVRRGANTATSAAAAAPADSAAAAPGRVLAPFVPSKAHSCADCEACRLRKDIAATQAAIVAAWEKQDRRAASGVGISEAARVPLPDVALEALLRSVVEGAVAGPGVDAARLSLLPLSAISTAFAAPGGKGDNNNSALEEVLRGTAGAAARLEGVVAVAPRSEEHLRALVSLAADPSDTAATARTGRTGVKAALWDAAPNTAVAVMLAVRRQGPGTTVEYVPAGLFGPAGTHLVKRVPGWVSEAKLRLDGIIPTGLFGPGQHEHALLTRKAAPAIAKHRAAAAEAALAALIADDVAVALSAAAAEEGDKPRRFCRADAGADDGTGRRWYRLEKDDSDSFVIGAVTTTEEDEDHDDHPCGGAWRLFACENAFSKL